MRTTGALAVLAAACSDESDPAARSPSAFPPDGSIVTADVYDHLLVWART